jgi:hypothetical protein
VPGNARAAPSPKLKLGAAISLGAEAAARLVEGFSARELEELRVATATATTATTPTTTTAARAAAVLRGASCLPT